MAYRDIMRINDDFSQPVLIQTQALPWVASPIPGVERKMLDRIGHEVARATSLVRYQPGSRFSEHTHGGGEEFVVLAGTFEDESGIFPTGTYVRNPPTSSHTPSSTSGCTLFVKLWQFDPHDRTHCQLNMTAQLAQQAPGHRARVLHTDALEHVTYHELAPSTALVIEPSNGIELLLLEGELAYGNQTLHQYDWLRLPKGSDLHIHTNAQSACLWMKTGHL